MSATATPIFITVPTKYIPINVATMGGVVPVKPLAKRPPPATSVAPSSIGSDDECSSSMDEFIVRHKKRRLDHLTHEEKMQRKKLKNRVAAQTSRDRKKAKMEEMEKTIAEQSEQISALERRCSELDAEKGAINEKYLGLERRFEELQQRLIANEQEQKRREREQEQAAAAIKREVLEPLLVVPGDGSVGCVTAGRQTGSAAGTPGRAGSSADDTSADQRRAVGGLVEDHCHMPTLQDMLDDFDMSQLEELAESLLADVGADLEGTDRPGCPSPTEDDGPGGRLSRSVVGPAAELVESGRPATDAGSRLILTTHNYSKSPFYELAPKVEPPPTVAAAAPPSATEREQHHTIDSSTILEPAIPEDQPLILTNSSSETLYGTYDNDTNCITIVLTEEDALESELEGAATVKLENDLEMSCDAAAVDQEETVTTGSALMSPLTIRPPSPLQELLSPIAPHGLKSPGGFSSVSDAGYESIGSPTHSLFSTSSQKETIPSGSCHNGSSSGVSEEDGLPSEYGLGSLNEFWNLDLFPILE
uniref:X-box-binding protein 1 n=1 Tax=Anopheles triannulatus TaxID=58253 RepID=A0A2M3ZYX1_9DIPT